MLNIRLRQPVSIRRNRAERWFRKYPETSQTSTYYQPGSPEVGRPGYFNVNTYALNLRPKWETEVLAFRNSVPGHHPHTKRSTAPYGREEAGPPAGAS